MHKMRLMYNSARERETEIERDQLVVSKLIATAMLVCKGKFWKRGGSGWKYSSFLKVCSYRAPRKLLCYFPGCSTSINSWENQEPVEPLGDIEKERIHG